MISRLMARMGADTTKFQRGKMTSREEFDAAHRVDQLERQVEIVGECFKQLQIPGQDSSSACGTVSVPDGQGNMLPTRGYVEYDAAGKVKNIETVDGYEMSVKTRGDKREICVTSSIGGAGICGGEVLRTEEWVISSGNAHGSGVKHRTFSWSELRS